MCNNIKRANLESFYRGCLELWKWFKITRSEKLNQNIIEKYHMPRCSKSYYINFFKSIDEEPTYEQCVELRKQISDRHKVECAVSKSHIDYSAMSNKQLTDTFEMIGDIIRGRHLEKINGVWYNPVI